MIQNKGELNISSLILLGASTKRDDQSKIGFFGSGNKYAIATLLRKGVSFKIFTGEREIKITTSNVEFRDMNFQRIHIDGEATSLTTDMGPQWEEWMAIREWVSNSIDEGDSNVINETEHVSGREGYTRFFIEHATEVKKVIDLWDEYFTFDRLDCIEENKWGKLFPQTITDETMILYRKGIRAYYQEGTKSLYHYDMNGFIINESRLIESTHNANYRVLEFLNECSNIGVLRNILKNAFTNTYWEGGLSWKWGISKLSDHWRTAIGNHIIIVNDVTGYYKEEMSSHDYYIVNLDMAYRIKHSFPDVKVYGINNEGEQALYKKVELTSNIEFLIKDCLKFLEETEYKVSNDIEVVQFEKSEVWGMADNNKILLSEKVFEQGKKEIVRTIMEEQEHLRTGYKDCSRSFQNHWINLYLSEKENRFGHFL
jgi:hypothetical protein